MAAKLIYVFSTLSSSVLYQLSKHNANGVPEVKGEVLIKGGAGIANEHLITPDGVPTLVTAEQRELLEANETFKVHAANGFIKIVEGTASLEEVVADMNRRDGSAPLVDADLAGVAAPKAGTATPAKKR